MAHARSHLPPIEVGHETFLLRGVRAVAGAPLSLYANSLVIRGAEPVVIDTGAAADRERWLADVAALVDLAAVRWVVLSHDGEDHRGGLAALLDRSPRATVVTCWSAPQRNPEALRLPAARSRWIGAAAVLDAGDRVLRILRPPAYDSPASRALFDPTTGVLWASDLFVTPMPSRPVERVDQLAPRWWREGMAMLHHHALSPWLAGVDRAAYAGDVRRLRALDPAVVVAAHAPVISGPSIAAAFTQLEALPDTDPPPPPARPCAAGTGDASVVAR